MNSLKKIPTSQIIRHVIQLVAFILYPGLFISVFSALRSIVSSIIGGSFSLQAMASQILLIIAIFPITILWGRFFCGYLCSFGAMGDLIYFLAGKLGLKPLRLSPKADDLLRLVKYAILAANLILIWILGYKVDSSFSPWSVFGLITAGHFKAILVPGLALLILIIAASALIERFFCRYLCPLGALFSLVSVGRFYRIKRDDNSCTGCTLCSKKCSMGIDVHNTSSVYSGECIDCMKCIDVCPKKSLSASPRPAVAGSAAALATLGLVFAGHISSNHLSSSGAVTSSAAQYGESIASDAQDGSSTASSADTNSSISSSSAAPANDSAGTSSADAKNGSNTPSSADMDAETAGSTAAYPDGTYTGSGRGFRGSTEVSVTVSGGKITDITVTSYRDDEEFFAQAKSSVISDILTSQSLDVDAVSGATYSSEGIIQAVADALDIDFDSSTAEKIKTDADKADTTETTTAKIEKTETDPAIIGNTETDTANTETETEAETDKSNNDPDIDLSQIADGTYTGSGTGFRGTTEVSVTVKDHKITDITITSYQDDQQFFESAESALIPEIIDEQSIQVDAVSGATYSGNGILEAVANALGTTFSNPNSENPGRHSHGGFGEGGMGRGGKGKHRFDHSSDDDEHISDDDDHDQDDD